MPVTNFWVSAIKASSAFLSGLYHWPLYTAVAQSCSSLILVLSRVALDADVLERLVGGDERQGAGNLVALAALEAHQTILDQSRDDQSRCRRRSC